MSLYTQTEKSSRARTTTSKDLFSAHSSPSQQRAGPRSGKFANVQATIDTGAHAGNVKVKVDRSGEQFRRINRRQLHQLMLAVERSDESVFDLQQRWDEVEDNDDVASMRSGRSTTSISTTLSSSTQPLVTTHSHLAGHAPAAAAQAGNEHFLLLDVRDDDAEFRRAHISGAMHYPPPLLRRDHFPPQLYKFRNAANKLIVLYDIDDTSRIGLECATLFIQKGFQNIFVLTGGLKHFAAKYWDYCGGEHPPGPPPEPKPTGRAGSVSSRTQSMAGTPASSRPITGASIASSRMSTAAASARPGGVGGIAAGSARTGNPATSLGARQPAERLSPREALLRAQAAGGASQRPPATATRAAGSASSSPAISARAFR